MGVLANFANSIGQPIAGAISKFENSGPVQAIGNWSAEHPHLSNALAFTALGLPGLAASHYSQQIGNGYSAGSYLSNVLNNNASASANSDSALAQGDLNKFLDSISRTESEQLDKNMAFNAHQAELTRQFNAQESQKLRDWQERMSNTSYQRAMKDMAQAGLNPILAFQNGGASTPSGSSASSSNASMSTSGGIKLVDLITLLSVVGGIADKFNPVDKVVSMLGALL